MCKNLLLHGHLPPHRPKSNDRFTHSGNVISQIMFPQLICLDPRTWATAEFTHYLVERVFLKTMPIAISLLTSRIASQCSEIYAEYTLMNANVTWICHPAIGSFDLEAEPYAVPRMGTCGGDGKVVILLRGLDL